MVGKAGSLNVHRFVLHPVIRAPVYCQKKPGRRHGAWNYNTWVTLPVGSVPDVTMVRPPVNLAVFENARREGIGRGGNALGNRRGIVGYDALILKIK